MRKNAPKWVRDKWIRLAREVKCPVCGARKGRPCPSVAFGFHYDRSELARQQRLADPTEVRRLVGCPFCGVDAGWFCMGTRKPRKANHSERVQAYKRAVDPFAAEGGRR